MQTILIWVSDMWDATADIRDVIGTVLAVVLGLVVFVLFRLAC
jgi:glycopeptide antibiotics resistance protein